MSGSGRTKIGAALDPHFSSHTPSSRRDDFAGAMLTKLEAAAAEAEARGWEAFFIAGDVFGSAVISRRFEISLMRVFKSFCCPVYAIAGNHDLKHRELETLLDDTPFGSFVEGGAFSHRDRVILNNATAVTLMHYSDQPKVPDPSPEAPVNVLVAHQYMRRSPYGKGSGVLSDDDLRGYDLAIVGHDHEAYEDYVTEHGTIVTRFGSLSRGTKHEHNLHRTPKLAEFTIDAGDGIEEVELIDVPAGDDVFAEAAVLESSMGSNMRSFVGRLEEGAEIGAGSGDTPTQVLERVVKERDVDDRVADELRARFDAVGAR